MSMNIISLTTIPSRIKYIEKTLKSLLKQTALIDLIVVNISRSYKRFPNFNPESLKLDFVIDSKIKINFCEDYGPASKILSLMDSDLIDSTSSIVFLDDDRIYHKKLIEKLLQQSEKFPSYCIANSTWDTSIFGKDFDYSRTLQPRSIEFKKEGFGDIFLGCCGVLIKPYMLRNHDFDLHVGNCPELFYSDDLFLSAVLAKNEIPIYSIVDKDCSRSANDDIDPLANIDRKQKYSASMNYLCNTLGVWR